MYAAALSRFIFQEGLQLPLECMQTSTFQNIMKQEGPHGHLLAEEPFSSVCVEARLHFEAGFTFCP